jgi:hypothetical protein
MYILQSTAKACMSNIPLLFVCDLVYPSLSGTMHDLQILFKWLECYSYQRLLA